MPKTCAKCGNSKEHDCFYKDSSRADGMSYSCRVCTLERMAAKRLSDPLAAKAKDAQKRKSNKENILASAARYRKANPEKVKETREAFARRRASSE